MRKEWNTGPLGDGGEIYSEDKIIEFSEGIIHELKSYTALKCVVLKDTIDLLDSWDYLRNCIYSYIFEIYRDMKIRLRGSGQTLEDFIRMREGRITNIKIILEDDNIDNLWKLIRYFDPFRELENDFEEKENKTGIYVSYVIRELVGAKRNEIVITDIPVEEFFSKILSSREDKFEGWELSLYPDVHDYTEFEKRFKDTKYYRGKKEIDDLRIKIKEFGKDICKSLEGIARNWGVEFDKDYSKYVPLRLLEIIDKPYEKFECNPDLERAYIINYIKVVLERDKANFIRLINWFDPLKVEPLSSEVKGIDTGIYVSYLVRKFGKWSYEMEVPVDKLLLEMEESEDLFC